MKKYFIVKKADNRGGGFVATPTDETIIELSLELFEDEKIWLCEVIETPK